MGKKFAFPDPVRLAQALFLLNALVWAGLAAAVALREGGVGLQQAGLRWIIAGMMFANAAAMLAAGIGIGRRKGLFYLFALSLLSVNILLTFTDQFGLWDWITLVLDSLLLGLTIAGLAHFSRPGTGLRTGDKT